MRRHAEILPLRDHRAAKSLLPPPPRVTLLGVEISATRYGEVLGLCRHWIEQKRAWRAGFRGGQAPPCYCIFVCTVHAVMTAVLDAEFRRMLNASDINTTDGMPLAWALRSFGVKGQHRVYGPDLMLALCGQAARLGHRIYLFGGREEVIPILRERLERRFPRIQIAGSYSRRDPPSSTEADRASIEAVREANADIVFVGFGQPRQERWMLSHRNQLPSVVMIGVGAAFDFHAGRIQQAPAWMQRWGLEWLFRLLMEPRRLWRRYLLLNPFFLALWALQLLDLLRQRRTAKENP